MVQRIFSGIKATKGLISEAKTWIKLAFELLSNKLFIHTTVNDKCKDCAFSFECTDALKEITKEKLASTKNKAAAELALLWEPAAEKDEEDVA